MKNPTEAITRIESLSTENQSVTQNLHVNVSPSVETDGGNKSSLKQHHDQYEQHSTINAIQSSSSSRNDDRQRSFNIDDDLPATPAEIAKEEREIFISKLFYVLSLLFAIGGIIGFGVSGYYVPYASDKARHYLDFHGRFESCWSHEGISNINLPSTGMLEAVSYMSVIIDVLWTLCILCYKCWIDAKKWKLFIIFGTLIGMTVTIAILVTYVFIVFIELDNNNACNHFRGFNECLNLLRTATTFCWLCDVGLTMAYIVRKIRNKYFFHYYAC